MHNSLAELPLLQRVGGVGQVFRAVLDAAGGVDQLVRVDAGRLADPVLRTLRQVSGLVLELVEQTHRLPPPAQRGASADAPSLSREIFYSEQRRLSRYG